MNQEQIENMCNNFILVNDTLDKQKEEQHLILEAKLDMVAKIKEQLDKELAEQKEKYNEAVKQWREYSWKNAIAKQLKDILLDEFNCEVIETFNTTFQLIMRVRELATNKIYSIKLEANFRDNKMSLFYATGESTNEFGKDTLGASLGMNDVFKPFTELTRHNFNEVLHECPKEIQEEYNKVVK